MYVLLKHLHVTCVVLTGVGFLGRLVLMLGDSVLLHGRLARRLPHVIDSVLLASALSLAYLSGQYPFLQGWLTAKVLGLLAYILLGTMALKRGRTKAIRIRFAILAILAYAYIVSVALTRHPLPWGTIG